jgi:predicted lactoylglutathione lyase
MAKQIFVNLPVKDLKRSMNFFDKLGFKNNPQFTDDTAACMVVSDTIFVMLLTEPKFKSFAPKPISDADEQHRGVARAFVRQPAAGRRGRPHRDEQRRQHVCGPKDYGFMYQHGFADPDGHVWEVFWMDPNGMPAQQ